MAKKSITTKSAKKTKTTAAKTPAKDVAPKKARVPKEAAKVKDCCCMTSERVADDKVFFLIDGSTIASMQELVDAFDRMSDDIYYYHVTPDRNDFASWVKEVLVNEELSEKLVNAQGPMKAQVTILRYLLKW